MCTSLFIGLQITWLNRNRHGRGVVAVQSMYTRTARTVVALWSHHSQCTRNDYTATVLRLNRPHGDNTAIARRSHGDHTASECLATVRRPVRQDGDHTAITATTRRPQAECTATIFVTFWLQRFFEHVQKPPRPQPDLCDHGDHTARLPRPHGDNRASAPRLSAI